MSDLPADLEQQVRDGLITRREAENIVKGRRPDGRPRELGSFKFLEAARDRHTARMKDRK